MKEDKLELKKRTTDVDEKRVVVDIQLWEKDLELREREIELKENMKIKGEMAVFRAKFDLMQQKANENEEYNKYTIHL